MADADPGFNEDDDFDDYNPHPYQGGYDIALTYGHPLPPSAAICYPLSDAPPPQPSRPEPAGEPTPTPAPHGAGDGSPEPDHRPPYDHLGPGYGYQNPQPEPYSPDQFGHWPFLTPVDEERCLWRDRSGEPGYWNQWRRAADYLFGYSLGYGERRIGTDSYGVPIYAYRRDINQPLVLQVEPAKSHKLDFYEANHEQVYPIHSEASKRRDEKDYYEPAWYQNSSYDEVYEDQLDPHPKGSLAYDERGDGFHFFRTPNYAYDRHYYEEPLHVQVETVEPALTQTSYYNVYQEHVSSETNWHSSSSGEPLESFEPTWSRNPSQYGVYDEELSPEPKWHSPSNGESLEPFEPSWSRNPSYYGVYNEEPSPESKWLFSSHGERGADNYVFNNPSDAYGRQYNEQPLSVQLAPFKPTWSQDHTINYDAYKEKGDDSYEEITTQFFCPFQKYSDYDG